VFLSAGGVPVCCVVVDMVARLKSWHKHDKFCYKVPFVGWPWRVKNVSEWTVLPRIKSGGPQGTLVSRTWIPHAGTLEFRQVSSRAFQIFIFCFGASSYSRSRLPKKKSLIFILFLFPEPLSYAFDDSLSIFGGEEGISFSWRV